MSQIVLKSNMFCIFYVLCVNKYVPIIKSWSLFCRHLNIQFFLSFSLKEKQGKYLYRAEHITTFYIFFCDRQCLFVYIGTETYYFDFNQSYTIPLRWARLCEKIRKI